MNDCLLMPIHLRHLSLWDSTGEEPSLDAEGHEELNDRVVGVVELDNRVVVEVIVCDGSAKASQEHENLQWSCDMQQIWIGGS